MKTKTREMSGHKTLPKSYLIGAQLLRRMDAKKGSLNSLISQLNGQTNIKLIYALVIKTIQNLDLINEMIKTMANVCEDNQFLTQILIADLMFGKGLDEVKDVPKVRQIVGFVDQFQRVLKNKSKNHNRINKFIVRYLRVNLIKTNVQKIISNLIKNGFKQIDYIREETTFDQFKEFVINLRPNEFLIDYDFPNDLLVFDMNSTNGLKQLKAYNESKIVFQDKASLIPVECLKLRPGLTIMDVCSAPGMKTTAIASRIKNNGKIIAFDKSEERINEMKTIIVNNGVNCCQINCRDFTGVQTEEFGPIDAILLDPSCSGSGMNKRLDYNKSDQNKGRLYKLASFQTRMLCHAMTFGAKRIVYSTCSLSLIENENVIKSAFRESEFSDNYRVVKALPHWPTRGVGDYDFAHKCIRSDAQTSLTNGFFVCVLKRKRKK